MKEAPPCLDRTTEDLGNRLHRRRFEIRDDDSGIRLHPKLCAALLIAQAPATVTSTVDILRKYAGYIERAAM